MHHGQPSPRQSELGLEVARVRPRIREHEVRQGKGDLVDRTYSGRFGAAGRDQSAVPGEGVPQRHEGVEHEARAPEGGEQAAERHQEVPGIADDHGVDRQVPAMLQQ